MQIHHVSTGKNRIAFRQSSGEGRPVVLIHGNSASGRAFDHQLNGSLGATYRLVALDLPGHGDSAKADPVSAYSLLGYADAMVAVVEELALQEAVFVGWSLGGHILLQAADKLSKASGYLIFGTPPLRRPFSPQDCFFPHPAASCLFCEALSDDQVDAFARACLSPSVPDIPESFTVDIRNTDPVARSHLLARLQLDDFKDEVDILQRLNAPIAIFHGELDGLVRCDYLRSISIPGLWRGAPQVIPNAGHAPQWEAPEEFNAIAAQFVEDCDEMKRRAREPG